jgi:transposase
MPRTYGYATRGHRCYGRHDWNAKGRINVIGAIMGGLLLTIGLFQDNINTDIFTAWINQDLIPKLPKQAVVVMDNATFHKGQSMKMALQKEAHTLLSLPPYSPDLNPIEHKWAQAKASRRRENKSVHELFLNLKL